MVLWCCLSLVVLSSMRRAPTASRGAGHKSHVIIEMSSALKRKPCLLVDGDRFFCRGLLQFLLLHKTQDRFHHGVFTHGGIEHGMINRAVRPFCMEICFDRGGALPVNSIRQRLSF